MTTVYNANVPANDKNSMTRVVKTIVANLYVQQQPKSVGQIFPRKS